MIGMGMRFKHIDEFRVQARELLQIAFPLRVDRVDEDGFAVCRADIRQPAARERLARGFHLAAVAGKLDHLRAEPLQETLPRLPLPRSSHVEQGDGEACVPTEARQVLATHNSSSANTSRSKTLMRSSFANVVTVRTGYAYIAPRSVEKNDSKA